MVFVAEHAADPLERALLRAMFEARKQVFVDLLKWQVPVIDDRYEIDQFDDAHAVYLIVADDAGGHLGSARLLRTDRPHILDSLFPHLCAAAVPSGPDTLEITRFCLDRSLRARRRLQVRNQLVAALVDFALASETRTYTGVAELAWLQQILAFGWRCRPLGLPQAAGGHLVGALHIQIDEQTPQLLAENGIYTPQTLDRAALRAAA